MNQAPKQRFLELKNEAHAHRELVVEASFLRACDFAMLQVISETATANDPVSAAANWHRLEGARSFLSHLLNLGEQPKPVSHLPSGNLNHRV